MKPNSSNNIAIVVSLFNSQVTFALLESSLKRLEQAGITQEQVLVLKVPGAFEIPVTCKRVLERNDISCVIAIGCVIRGDTPHFDFIAAEVTRGLMDLSLMSKKPVIMGVLTCNTEEQALLRCHLGAKEDVKLEGIKPHPSSDKGLEFAEAALTMTEVFKEI